MSSRAKKVFLFFGILTGLITACLGLETCHNNHLGWALLFAGTAFIPTGCLSLGLLFIQPGGNDKNSDISLWLPCFGTRVISLIAPLEYLYLPAILPRGERVQDIGLILVAGALAFYLLSLQTKEPWHSHGFTLEKKQPPLISTILSPVSAALLLFALGLGIGFSSWTSLLLFFILLFPELLSRLGHGNQRGCPSR